LRWWTATKQQLKDGPWTHQQGISATSTGTWQRAGDTAAAAGTNTARAGPPASPGHQTKQRANQRAAFSARPAWATGRQLRGRISTRRWPSPAANGPRGAAAVPCLASPVVKLASSSILLLPASHRQRAASIGGVLLAAFIRTRYLVIVSEIQITSAGSYVLPVTTPSGKNGRLVASTPSWTW